MQTVISILVTLLVFTLIVVIHEGGHFLMARKMGVRVEEFAIGMGPKLFSFTSKKDTVFSFRLFPIGGFCRMLGEDEAVDDENSFSSKSVWARIAIVAAGPIMNFVLAFVLLLGINLCTGYIENRVAAVEAGSPAAEAGMLEGDKIVAINGKRIRVFNKISYLMYSYKGEGPIEVTVKRDGEKETLSLTPLYDEELQRYRMGFSAAATEGGIGAMVRARGWGQFPAILGGMIAQSFWYVGFEIETTVVSVVQLFTGALGLDALSGPIGVVSVVGETIQETKSYGFGTVLLSLLSLMVLLSANLGILNLFPIPALDGSRIVILLVEKIRRKPMNQKVETIIYLVGFILLIGLMLVVAFNDVLKMVH